MRHRTAEWSMLRVHASFVDSSLRRAMTTWVAYAEERRSAEEKARAVVVRLSPEGRALGRALNRWSAAGRRRRATLRTLAAVVHRRTVAAVNTRRDAAADATARRRRLSSALHRMTRGARAGTGARSARRRPRGAAAAAPGIGGCAAVSCAPLCDAVDAAAAARRSRVLLTRALHSCLLHAIAAWRGAKPPPAVHRAVAAWTTAFAVRGTAGPAAPNPGLRPPRRQPPATAGSRWAKSWRAHVDDLVLMRRAAAGFRCGGLRRAVGSWCATWRSATRCSRRCVAAPPGS